MFMNDVRYGFRALLRAPGFAAAAIVTLGLGIGANTAIFTVVHAALLRPLPYPQPEQLVRLVRHSRDGLGSSLNGRRYLFFRDHLRNVQALSAQAGFGSMNLVHGDAAEFVTVAGVSKEYFTVIGVQPALGQPFAAKHDVTGGPDVLILGHSLWQRLFGGDASIVGRTVSLADKPYTIIGVMPSSFDRISRTGVLVPLRPGLTGRGGGYNYSVTGRLRDGVTIEQASGEAAAVWESFKTDYPTSVLRNELPSGFVTLQEMIALPVRQALLVMAGAVGLLLLIACANTANLLLARAAGRGREFAVRAALGASRGRIVRQMLTESLLLAAAGGALGLGLAQLMVRALMALTPPAYVVVSDVAIDATVLAAAMIATFGTGVLFGLAPALSTSRADLVEAFKDDGARSIGSRRSGWLRRSLVVGQVAICMLLLIGAGLLLRTFINLRAVDPGFDTRGVMTARMSLQGERYSTPEAVIPLFEHGLERIRAIPGVRSAAVVSGVPLEPALNLNVDVLDGPEDERVQDALTDWRYATAGYFDTMGVRIVAGRAFDESDRAGAPPVAIVSEEFARRLFRGTPRALGRHIRVFDADGAIEIVGVAKDLREGGLRGRQPIVMYVPAAQAHAQALRTTHSYFAVNWIVRADKADASLSRQIEEAMRTIDPKQPFSLFRTMDESRSRAVAIERFQMTLLGVFAAIGLLLATAGIYGLISYTVAQRTREFGIRSALGATHRQILWSVLRQGASMAVAGVVAGCVAAFFATQVLRNFVWGVSTLDATTFAAVAVILIAVSCAASLIPALRAVRLNPVAALRE